VCFANCFVFPPARGEKRKKEGGGKRKRKREGVSRFRPTEHTIKLWFDLRNTEKEKKEKRGEEGKKALPPASASFYSYPPSQ